MQAKYGLSINFTACELHVKLELRGVLKFLTYFIFLHVPSHLSRFFGVRNNVKLEICLSWISTAGGSKGTGLCGGYWLWSLGDCRKVESTKLQGVSQWNVSFKLTLTDGNMQTRIYLKVVLTFWDYRIWVSSTSF